MDKEESFLKNRFSDLANSSYNRNIYTYTDFLNLNEISILNSYKNQLPPVNVELAGGNDYAERRIAVFSPEDIYYTQDLPIKLIEIAPINSHYADKLSHRDVLGAILNLGIVRNKIGDIFLKDNQAYVYCMDDISGYIAENLKKIKHTIVKCTVRIWKLLILHLNLKLLKALFQILGLTALLQQLLEHPEAALYLL